MNLYTPGDGWFGTHVTWEDVEEDMRRELHTSASFGKNKSVENIGDGKGFMSRIVLVDPDWQHKDSDLPERFVVKILTLLAMRKLNDDMVERNGADSNFFTEELMLDFEERAKVLHNAEVTLYNHVMALPGGKFPAPKIYYTRKFSESNPVKGYIIMEHMEDAKIVNIYENVPPTAMKKILHALAFLEASFLKLNAEETKHFTQNMFSELYGPLLDEKAIESTIQSLRKFGGEYLSEKIDRLDDVVRKFLDATAADGLSEELGMQRVVCHGDLWSGNILWRRSDGDGLDLAALLDFQTISMGCAASDLVRVFCACLSGDDRQKHWEELLEQFYDYLKEEISDQLMPYSLEQLKESYRCFFPFGGFLIASIIGGLFDILCKNPDEEQKKKSMHAAREKLECLLDDIVFFYHRNQKSLDQKHLQTTYLHIPNLKLEMNLYTVGEGLFDTHVTWEDIEEDMRRELHTDAYFGPNKSAENIGDGKGFMSRVVLVNPDWQCKDKDLPEKFIVKIVTQLVIRKTFEELADKNNKEDILSDGKLRNALEKQQKKIHNAEATLYAYLKTLPVGKFPTPKRSATVKYILVVMASKGKEESILKFMKIYYMRKFSESNKVKGYIIMEFMENCKVVHIYENISLQAMNEILRALAVLEATLLKSNAKFNSFTKNILAELYGPFINEKDTKLTIQSLREFAGGYMSEKVDKLDEIVTEILNLTSADSLSEELGMRRVVCHGDLWSANILWRQNDGDNLKMAALIDFQTVNMGCPATDLVRVFSSCLSGKDRREHWEELLEQFYDYLKEEIADQQMPYTLEQLKESYRRFFALGGFFIAAMISSFFNIMCKNPDEKQMKSIDTAKEKLEALLDDIIFFHQRNLKLNGTKTFDKCLCTSL